MSYPGCGELHMVCVELPRLYGEFPRLCVELPRLYCVLYRLCSDFGKVSCTGYVMNCPGCVVKQLKYMEMKSKQACSS